MDISCKIKENYATIPRPRETRQQGGFVWISLGRENRMRTGGDGHESDQIWGQVLKEATGKTGCISGSGKNLAQGNHTGI